MVHRCTPVLAWRTHHHTEYDPVFQGYSVHTFVLIVLPLFPSPLTQGTFVASTETHSVQVSSTKELVIACIRLRCTYHGTVLSLNRSPTTFLASPSRDRKSLVYVSVSGSECGVTHTLNFSMISRAQSFGFNHRPVRRISALDIS